MARLSTIRLDDTPGNAYLSQRSPRWDSVPDIHHHLIRGRPALQGSERQRFQCSGTTRIRTPTRFTVGVQIDGTGKGYAVPALEGYSRCKFSVAYQFGRGHFRHDKDGVIVRTILFYQERQRCNRSLLGPWTRIARMRVTQARD